MFAIYRVMLPLLLVVSVLMGLWVSFLHFPSEWVLYIVMGIELLVATIVMAMEYQAQNLNTSSGWGGSWYKCLFSSTIRSGSIVNVELPKILDLKIQNNKVL